VTGPLPAYGLRIKRTDGSTDLIIIRCDQQPAAEPAPPSTFAGGTTNALISIIRLNAQGNPTDLGLLGGTELSYAGQRLALAAPGIKWSN